MGEEKYPAMSAPAQTDTKTGVPGEYFSYNPVILKNICTNFSCSVPARFKLKKI
jgi:hypothetical protein